MDKKTILYCSCGWRSKELSRGELPQGVPWYCKGCGKKPIRFVTFQPHERLAALKIVGSVAPETTVQSLAAVATERQSKAVSEYMERFPSGLILDRDREDLAVLLAEEFRAGVNLALEFYGLEP